MHKYVLEVNGVSKTFGKCKVIDNLSFKVAKRDIYGILGPEKAGKTTIIKMILSLVYPDQGNIKINGYDINVYQDKAFKHVGAVIDRPKFFDFLTGYQNLFLIKNYYPEIKKTRIDEVIALLGLSDIVYTKVKRYTPKARQKLAVARSLLNYPQLVLLDEPMLTLEDEGQAEMKELIKELAVNNITFFITAHLPDNVKGICNKVSFLKKRRLSAESIDELLTGDKEIVKIFTDEEVEAANLLKNKDFIKSIWPVDNGLEVEIEKGYSEKLLKQLINNNIKVNYLVPKRKKWNRKILNTWEKD